jgi:hypothetical protein
MFLNYQRLKAVAILFKTNLNEKENIMALEKIEFFGVADRQGKKADGKVTSQYPAWYFDNHINELQEDINRIENELNNNLVPENAFPQKRADIKRLKERMTMIIKSKPKLNAKDIDTLAGIYKDLANQIGDSMFTYTEMQKGLVSSHEEARRMVQPIINVSPECASVLPQLGITPKNGKISRNEATRVFQIVGKLLDEKTNAEYLRKDYAYNTYHGSKSLAEVMAE